MIERDAVGQLAFELNERLMYYELDERIQAVLGEGGWHRLEKEMHNPSYDIDQSEWV